MKYIDMILIMGLIAILASCGSVEKQPESINLTKWVNPFISTEAVTEPALIGYTPHAGWCVWAGLTHPGAALRTAMVQLSAVTKFGTGAGYQYEDSVIKAFSHTNPGHWNLARRPVLPVT